MDRRRYQPPSDHLVSRVAIAALVEGARTIPDHKLRRLPGYDAGVFCVGELALAKRTSVAVVGSRKVSPEGAARAGRLAKELVGHGIVVVSGLAEGVDQNAHQAAIDADSPVARCAPGRRRRLPQCAPRRAPGRAGRVARRGAR